MNGDNSLPDIKRSPLPPSGPQNLENKFRPDSAVTEKRNKQLDS